MGYQRFEAYDMIDKTNALCYRIFQHKNSDYITTHFYTAFAGLIDTAFQSKAF